MDKRIEVRVFLKNKLNTIPRDEKAIIETVANVNERISLFKKVASWMN